MDNAMDQKILRQEEIERLKQVAAAWHHLAKCKFNSAKYYRDGDFGRRFIEHGAICYRNCAWELERQIRRLEGLEVPEEYSVEASPLDNQK